MGLRTQVIYFVRPNLLDQLAQARGIRQITKVQLQRNWTFMRIRVDVVQAISVKRGSPADDPMYLVALRDQQLCKIRSILPGDATDQGLSGGRHYHEAYLIMIGAESILANFVDAGIVPIICQPEKSASTAFPFPLAE